MADGMKEDQKCREREKRAARYYFQLNESHDSGESRGEETIPLGKNDR